MYTFKNIYKILIGLTIFSILVSCLDTFNVIDITTETGLIITSIATTFLGVCFVFSRNANVIANRINGLGTLITIILFVYLLINTIQLLTKSTMPEFITVTMNILIILSTLLALIFEVPQANSSHATFQKLVALSAIITCILGIVYYNSYRGLFKSQTSNFYGYGYETPAGYQTKLESINTLEKVFTVSIYLTLGGFIINPMLRAYYIDKDYSSVNEIDELIANTNKYQVNNTTPNPNKLIDNKYIRPQPQTMNQPQIQTPPITPVEFQQPVEVVADLPHEKVVNPNFKQEDLPEAIIPSITTNEPTNEPVNQPQPTVSENNNTNPQIPIQQ